MAVVPAQSESVRIAVIAIERRTDISPRGASPRTVRGLNDRASAPRRVCVDGDGEVRTAGAEPGGICQLRCAAKAGAYVLTGHPRRDRRGTCPVPPGRSNMPPRRPVRQPIAYTL